MRFAWLLLLSSTLMLAADASYQTGVEKWRRQSEARLKADNGWLTVAGLFWLKEGENRFGTAAGNEIVLPPGSAASYAGSFWFHDGQTALQMPGQAKRPLQSDAHEQKPDEMKLGGRLTLFVIKRGDKYGVRLRDTESRMRREFTRRTWMPVRDAYRVNARWTPYDPPKMIKVPNILGQVEEQPSPGIATFTLNGVEHNLEPVLEDGKLFFIFRDQTTGKSTYPAGRFFYADQPVNGRVELDFNKAYNPPCAFTPYATCPLPPAQNRLRTRVEAGELTYHHE